MVTARGLGKQRGVNGEARWGGGAGRGCTPAEGIAVGARYAGYFVAPIKRYGGPNMVVT